MDPSHHCLVDEIKRQIRVLDPDRSGNRRAQQKKKYLGTIDARQQDSDQRYRTDLLTLLSNLTGGMYIRIPIATYPQPTMMSTQTTSNLKPKTNHLYISTTCLCSGKYRHFAAMPLLSIKITQRTAAKRFKTIVQPNTPILPIFGKDAS